ncbi:MAG: DUF3419 family protein [Patescibacteria group bacterium]|nr:DUF3419 family protein [Patescibacteria group bacterium]
MEEKFLNLAQTISQDQVYDFFGGIDLEKIFTRKSYPVWAFTNESLEEIGHLTSFKNKEIISILGSGDQLIYFLTKGAKLVIGVDHRPLACLWVEFKISALKNLSFKEFKEIFFEAKKENSKIYFEKIRSSLSSLAKKFFDYLFEGLPRNIFSTLKKSKFFYGESWFFLKKKDWLPYLINQKEFSKVKKRINNFFLFNTDFEKALKIFRRRFDLIYTSNIFDSKKYCQDSERTIILIDLNLKEKGEILMTAQENPIKIVSLLEKMSYNLEIKKPKRRFFEFFYKTFPYYYLLAKRWGG